MSEHTAASGAHEADLVPLARLRGSGKMWWPCVEHAHSDAHRSPMRHTMGPCTLSTAPVEGRA